MDRNATSRGFPGDNFSNNLFTDLAPLLALFGDQMTKQFLAMSMGWMDNALIAICPIGVLTVMVSAIRIGGTSKLKALIGRYVAVAYDRLDIPGDGDYELMPSSLPGRARVGLRLKLSCSQLPLQKSARCGLARKSSELLGKHLQLSMSLINQQNNQRKS